MKTQSQNLIILNYLKTGSSISSLFAFAKFNITRCAARINDIEKAGVTIDREWQGEGQSKYISYKLASKPKRK